MNHSIFYTSCCMCCTTQYTSTPCLEELSTQALCLEAPVPCPASILKLLSELDMPGGNNTHCTFLGQGVSIHKPHLLFGPIKTDLPLNLQSPAHQTGRGQLLSSKACRAPGHNSSSSPNSNQRKSPPTQPENPMRGGMWASRCGRSQHTLSLRGQGKHLRQPWGDGSACQHRSQITPGNISSRNYLHNVQQLTAP